MKKQYLVAVIFQIALMTGVLSCAQKKLSSTEKQLVGTWKKDWYKTLDDIKAIPEADSLVPGLSILAEIKKSDRFNFNENQTFEFETTSSMATTRSHGTWWIDGEKDFFPHFRGGTTEGLFGTESIKPYQIHYRLISIANNEITMRVIDGPDLKPGPFIEYLIRQD